MGEPRNREPQFREPQFKEVIAVIRPEQWQETVDAAQAMGLSECSHVRVMGRGKQRGLRYMRPVNDSDDGVMQFLPKRMLSWLVPAEMTGGLIRAIVAVNKTEAFGDGKVFVCPVDEVILSPEEAVAPESALPQPVSPEPASVEV